MLQGEYTLLGFIWYIFYKFRRFGFKLCLGIMYFVLMFDRHDWRMPVCNTPTMVERKQVSPKPLGLNHVGLSPGYLGVSHLKVPVTRKQYSHSLYKLAHSETSHVEVPVKRNQYSPSLYKLPHSPTSTPKSLSINTKQWEMLKRRYTKQRQ